MSEPKLYRHNESGKVVACDIEGGKYSHVYMWEGCGATPKRIATDRFLSLYTAQPEAPKPHSTAWAVCQALEGKTVKTGFITSKGLDYIELKKGNDYGLLGGKDQRGNSYTLQLVLDISNPDPKRNCDRITFVTKYQWEIVEAPKPIVELLPHEFVEGQEVLVKPLSNQVLKEYSWLKRKFSSFCDQGYICTNSDGVRRCHEYCLPYADNEPLEGTITGCEHGAVPKGYVPPHTPKLGDVDYWMVGGVVVDFAIATSGKVVEVYENGIVVKLGNGVKRLYYINGTNHLHGQRRIFHKNSTVDENGTVHEHIPTRPHKIMEGE